MAVDGGANRILHLARSEYPKHTSLGELLASFAADHVPLEIILGDLDSLSEEARTFFTTPCGDLRVTDVIHDPDQESTDFTKAIRHVRAHQGPGALDVVCMGGLGGRVDQGLSQLHHLYMFQGSQGSEVKDADKDSYGRGRMFLLSGESLTFLLRRGKHRIHAREDDDTESPAVFAKHVGIIPIREPATITTHGLEWDVTNWRTEFGGRMSTSNHVVSSIIEVETSTDVLFTIALRI